MTLLHYTGRSQHCGKPQLRGDVLTEFTRLAASHSALLDGLGLYEYT